MVAPNTFADAYARAKNQGGTISLLLGNGFSIGACPEFRDGSLWTPFVQNLASHGFSPSRFPGNQSGLEGVPIGETPQGGQSRIVPTNDTEAARSSALVKAVSMVHPKGRQKVTEKMLCDAASFISTFDGIYTTNYDLLVYWVCMHLLEGKCGGHGGPPRIEDGFLPRGSKLPDWEPLIYRAAGSPPRIDPKMVHYLHGALHLFPVATDGGGTLTMKLARAPKRTIPRLRSVPAGSLLDQVRTQIQSGQYPLCVVGSSPAKKLELIGLSDYLSAAYRRLQSAGGHLFTYGWSFSHADQHIVSTVLDGNRFSSVSVGVYRNGDGLLNRLQEYGAFLPGRPPIYSYDAESVAVWGANVPV